MSNENGSPLFAIQNSPFTSGIFLFYDSYL